MFYYKKYPILTLLGNNRICVPYHIIDYTAFDINDKQLSISQGGKRKIKRETPTEKKSGFKLATFVLLFNYHLINMHYLYINKKTDDYKQTQALMKQLLSERNNYLKKNKLTVVDDSLFKEFTFDCIGFTEDLGYKQRSNRDKKIFPFRYNCDDSDTPNIIFKNTSGNIINETSKRKIFK